MFLFVFTTINDCRKCCYVSHSRRNGSRSSCRKANDRDNEALRPITRRVPRQVDRQPTNLLLHNHNHHSRPFAVQRVRKTALQLARTYPVSQTPDLLIIEVAALLHDVLDKKYVSAEQASDPYGYFTPFFTSVAQTGGVDLIADGRARIITRVIENVSWSTEKKLREAGKIESWHRNCVELHCVQDADRLDAIGAFGT